MKNRENCYTVTFEEFCDYAEKNKRCPIKISTFKQMDAKQRQLFLKKAPAFYPDIDYDEDVVHYYYKDSFGEAKKTGDGVGVKHYWVEPTGKICPQNNYKTYKKGNTLVSKKINKSLPEHIDEMKILPSKTFFYNDMQGEIDVTEMSVTYLIDVINYLNAMKERHGDSFSLPYCYDAMYVELNRRGVNTDLEIDFIYDFDKEEEHISKNMLASEIYLNFSGFDNVGIEHIVESDILLNKIKFGLDVYDSGLL